MGAIGSKTIEYNGKEMTVRELIDKALKMEKELASKEAELQKYLQTNQEASAEAKKLESDLKEISDLKSKLEAEISSLTQMITDKDIAIGKKDLAISRSAAELEATTVLLKRTEDKLKEMEAKYSDSEQKLSTCETSLNEYKKNVADLEIKAACNVNKIAAARAFHSLHKGGPIKKILVEDLNGWYMYVVENFNDKWKNDDVGKYLWNIAIQYDNDYAICIFSTRAGILTPKDQPNILRTVNRALINAVEYIGFLNINNVFFNGVTAKKYTVKFWKGDYLQKETEDDNSKDAKHETIESITKPLKDLWDWMYKVSNGVKAEDDWEQKFDKSNYTMTATPEEGNVVDAMLDIYNLKVTITEKPAIPNIFSLNPRRRKEFRILNNVVTIEDAATIKAPFILRLEIQDLNECNRALEGFCPPRGPRNHSFLWTLVITIVVIFAGCLLYELLFKGCDKVEKSVQGNEQQDGQKTGQKKGGYYTYYTA